jgi:hypothetical protein
MGGGSQRDVDARVAQPPLDEGLTPSRDTERPQRCEFGRLRLSAYEPALPERAHEQDADAELVSQRQDRLLHVALQRVVRHLDGVDTAGGHEFGQFGERTGGVVGGTDQADQPSLPGVFEHRQMRAPGHQVVDLHHVDATAVPIDRAGQLGHPLVRRRSPHLVGDHHLLAFAVERVGEQALGRAVHRRGVDQPDANPECSVDELPMPAGRRGGLQPPPCAETDDRHAEPGSAEAPVLHLAPWCSPVTSSCPPDRPTRLTCAARVAGPVECLKHAWTTQRINVQWESPEAGYPESRTCFCKTGTATHKGSAACRL